MPRRVRAARRAGTGTSRGCRSPGDCGGDLEVAGAQGADAFAILVERKRGRLGVDAIMNGLHTTYRESIQELIDGTIGAIRRAELERHLAECSDCRSFLADMEAIHRAADSLEPLEPPDGVWLQIAGRLRQEGRVQAPPAPAPSHAPRYAMLAIAASLVLAIG